MTFLRFDPKICLYLAAIRVEVLIPDDRITAPQLNQAITYSTIPSKD